MLLPSCFVITLRPSPQQQQTNIKPSPDSFGKDMQLKCLAVVHQNQMVRRSPCALEFSRSNNRSHRPKLKHEYSATYEIGSH